MSNAIEKKLDAILVAIKGLDARVTRIEGANTARPAEDGDKPGARISGKKTSITEFLLEHPPTTDIQRTLAIGQFLESHGGMTSFTRPDLEKGYSAAKESPPSNIGVNIRHCIKDGHMMEADEKKNNKTAYVVTRRGEQFFKNGYKKTGGK